MAEAHWLRGGGEMGDRIREFDWSRTPLGPIDRWPQSLRTSVNSALDCAFPIVVWWGPELVILYNDEYRTILGAEKHPSALGVAGAKVWAEIWHVIGPMLDQVMSSGEATRSRDMLLHIDRGYLEEAYFSFSYSPIRDEHGRVAGIFCPVIETTEKVIGERRLRTLRDLAASTVAGTERAVFESSAEILAANPRDIPFALIYRIDAEVEPHVARLVASAGIERGSPAAPVTVPLDDDGDGDHAAGIWSLGTVARTGKPLIVHDAAEFEHAPSGAWAIPPRAAAVKPILLPGHDRPHAVLVAAVSPMRALDDDYQTFLGLVASQIASGLAEAQALEAERTRAEALADLDRAKTVFFSNVSHEFRTPLTLMLGPIEEELRDRPEPAPRLELAYRNSRRLLKLVNALLDFSRIEAGRMAAAYEPTDLAALTAELASVFRSAVEKAGLGLVVDCPPLPEPVFVDRDLWEKIVLNLLGNAFKFTFQGDITVRLRWAGDHVELSVRDTGVGIAEAELPRMFERFHRVTHVRSRTHEGTGIGLALVRELTRLHGGDVSVRSIEGVGSTFVASIRTGQAHLPADRVHGARGAGSMNTVTATAFVDEALRWLPNAGDAASRPAATLPASRDRPAAGAGAADASLARVLVADDNADMREYVRGLLAPRYDVLTCVDGQEALECVRSQPVDLIVADVMMPRLDGVELLSAIRGDERLRSLPVVMLSARAGEEARMEGLSAGADAYVVKPFSARELLVTVGSQLQLARMRRQHEQILRLNDRRKDEFIALLAHELRNPLAPVRNAVEILQRSAPGDATTRKLTEVMARQLTHMVRLVDDLLNVSRISRGQLDLRKAPADLAPILMQAIETARPDVEAAGLEFQLTLPAAPIVLDADAARLVQAIGNLLSNAAKFTDAPGRIWVMAEVVDGQAVIRVGDSGIGIEAAHLSQVFEMFVQLDRSLERRRAGLGLGLTIAKNLIELHGGTVEATSAGPGQGAEFIVRLPVPVWPLAASASERPAAEARPAVPPRRVLVVEDNTDSADMLAALLRMNGHEVRTARDGLSGVEAVDEFHPDIALIDIGLPALNGYDAAAQIRARLTGRRIPLIALTGWGQDADRRRSAQSGFDAHLVKPVDPAVLSRMVAELTDGTSFTGG